MDSGNDIFGHVFQVRMKERLLRDPVHGLIPIDEQSPHGRLVIDLINSREMQRLRRIRQLGLASFAFQGAEHSRFAHSIGAFHLLRLMLDQLGRMYTVDAELAFTASIASLLHDIGHGPFSHLSERVLGQRHEAWSVRILHDDRTQVGEILSAYSRRFPSMIESLLIGMAKPGFLSQLVSSELDADRLDYLLRDSLLTGVKYGVYDLDRLIHMLRISPDGERLIVAHGGLIPVEKYLQARYHMHRQVYRHKTVIAAEAMLAALLRRAGDLIRGGGDAGLPKGDVLGQALAYPDDLELPDYLELDDIEVLSRMKAWRRASDPVLQDLSRRLLDRELFKTIDLELPPEKVEAVVAAARAAVANAGLDPEYYMLLVQTTDTPYLPYGEEKAGKRIWIEDGRGGIVDVADLSPTLRAFTQSSYRATRLVFPAQAGEVDLRAEMNRLREAAQA